MISYLLSHGAKVNSRDTRGDSLLHHGIKQGTLEAVKLLVENGADIRAVDAHGLSAIFIAFCRQNRQEMVEYLLRKEALKSKESGLNNPTLLHRIREGILRDVKMLFDTGFDARCTDEDGLTALHHAVVNKDRRVVELVLDQKITPEARCNEGTTPFLFCVMGGTLENFKLLVSKGANVQSKDLNGRTAIHCVGRNANAAAIIDVLVELGLEIDARDDLGITPLQFCAQYGTLQNMKILIAKGASIKAKSNDGETALHFATKNKNASEIIKFLLSLDLMIDEPNERGFTALHYSIMFGYAHNTKLLLEKGANIEARAKGSKTVLHLAASYGDAVENLRCLLQKGAPIQVTDSGGRTPLLSCASKGNLEKMKLLVEQGANIMDRDEELFSSLHAAINEDTTEIMQYLLDKGMSLEVEDMHRRTPLLYSAANGNLKSVAFLCERGADLKSVDTRKMTALHHAAANVEGGPIIEYLPAKGIPVDARDGIGSSPLYISKVFKNAENEKILLRNGAKREPYHPAVHRLLRRF